jgi:mannose-6-phosphate isomerase
VYPLKFKNIYFDKIWGGRDLESFRDNLPEGEIGESWDVSCHAHGTSVVANGEFEGTKLDDLIKLKGAEIIGSEISSEWFPLLVKLINAKEKLSVQVHPNDSYARTAEGEMGKTEVWYVIDAFEGANLVVGTKNCTREQFRKAIETGEFDEFMNVMPVEKGDVYFVKSGLVHAIGEGVIIAEIQQNSDTTYRVYDYNRGRELHIEKALDVADLSLTGQKSKGLKVEEKGYSKTYYCLCEHFALELYDIKHSVIESSDEERFYIFTVVEGQGEIHYNGQYEALKKGDSILIPASLGEYEITGIIKLLKSYVPNMKRAKEEILSKVLDD